MNTRRKWPDSPHSPNHPAIVQEFVPTIHIKTYKNVVARRQVKVLLEEKREGKKTMEVGRKDLVARGKEVGKDWDGD